jgi:hypothetical protein
MTQSIESMIEVLQAYQAGKKVEYLSTMDGTWQPLSGDPLSYFGNIRYRIAPEPKKKVKLEAWLSPTGQLMWYDMSKVHTWSTDYIRVPSEDKGIEV